MMGSMGVYSLDREKAMGSSERSFPLHNFKLPCLKWGNQRYLRCTKLGGGGGDASASSAAEDSSSAVDDRLSPRRFHVVQRRRSPPSKFEGLMLKRQESERRLKAAEGIEEVREKIMKDLKTAEGIEEVREKIMKDLKTAADKIKDAIFRDKVSGADDVEVDEDEKQKQREEESPAAEVEAEARPWNLRTRRAACKTPVTGMNNDYNSPTKNDVVKSLRVRDGGPSSSAAADEKKRARLEFSVELSKKEIEDDFMVFIGRRPRKRPKKRPRHVQRELDTLFPGLLLTEVTADIYKVPELTENGDISLNDSL